MTNAPTAQNGHFNRYDPEFHRPRQWPSIVDPSSIARAKSYEGKPREGGAADSTVKWLQDAPAASADALVALAAQPSPPEPGPEPTPPPSSDSGIVWPRNENELAQALQDAAAYKYVTTLHPRTAIEMTKTIELQQASSGVPWGANGNYAKLQWKGPGGLDMIVIKGKGGAENRCLIFEKFSMDGNGWGAAPAGACVKLSAPEGDYGCIYKFTLRDIYTGYATYGFVLEGAVFEGMGENLHGENMRKDGMLLTHLNVGASNQAIVSNVQLIHPNMSRNYGAGIRSVYSVNILMGSFILNGEGGVVAPDGLRCAIMNNGENTGESVFVVPSNGYGSQLIANEGSTNNETVCREWTGNEWVDRGKPMKYLLDAPTSVSENHGHVATYGNATSPPVAVRKPQGK